MYSNDRKTGFSVLDLLVKIIFAALFVFLLIWLFKKNVPNMAPFYSNVFRENIKYMKPMRTPSMKEQLLLTFRLLNLPLHSLIFRKTQEHLTKSMRLKSTKLLSARAQTAEWKICVQPQKFSKAKRLPTAFVLS